MLMSLNSINRLVLVMKRVVHANRGAELLRITEVNVGPQKF